MGKTFACAGRWILLMAAIWFPRCPPWMWRIYLAIATAGLTFVPPSSDPGHHSSLQGRRHLHRPPAAPPGSRARFCVGAHDFEVRRGGIDRGGGGSSGAGVSGAGRRRSWPGSCPALEEMGGRRRWEPGRGVGRGGLILLDRVGLELEGNVASRSTFHLPRVG
jgi:hypothetical protein